MLDSSIRQQNVHTIRDTLEGFAETTVRLSEIQKRAVTSLLHQCDESMLLDLFDDVLVPVAFAACEHDIPDVLVVSVPVIERILDPIDRKYIMREMLLSAARSGSVGIATEVLFSRVIDTPLTYDSYVDAAASESVCHGHAEFLNALLCHNACEVRTMCSEWHLFPRLLNDAVNLGHAAVLDVLLRYVDCNNNTVMYKEPLQTAIKSGHMNLVRIIVSHYEMFMDKENKDSVLEFALAHGRVEIAEMLIAKFGLEMHDDIRDSALEITARGGNLTRVRSKT